MSDDMYIEHLEGTVSRPRAVTTAAPRSRLVNFLARGARQRRERAGAVTRLTRLRCVGTAMVMAAGLVAIGGGSAAAAGEVDSASIISTNTVYAVGLETEPIEKIPAHIRFFGGAIYELLNDYDFNTNTYYSTTVRRTPGQPGTTLIAGSFTGTTTYPANALQARFDASDFDIAVDGTIYLIDPRTRKVFKITPAGVISHFAGNGQPAPSGDGGPATQAGMTPTGLTIDPAGNLLVSDSYGQVYFEGPDLIRRITPTGIISTAVCIDNDGRCTSPRSPTSTNPTRSHDSPRSPRTARASSSANIRSSTIHQPKAH